MLHVPCLINSREFYSPKQFRLFSFSEHQNLIWKLFNLLWKPLMHSVCIPTTLRVLDTQRYMYKDCTPKAGAVVICLCLHYCNRKDTSEVSNLIKSSFFIYRKTMYKDFYRPHLISQNNLLLKKNKKVSNPSATNTFWKLSSWHSMWFLILLFIHKKV